MLFCPLQNLKLVQRDTLLTLMRRWKLHIFDHIRRQMQWTLLINMMAKQQFIPTTDQILVKLLITVSAISEVLIEHGVVTSLERRLLLHVAIALVIKQLVLYTYMTAKGKQITFKNPFDLIEEEEEPMSLPSHPQPRYQPAPTVVHTPLPFNPYEIKKEEKPVVVERRPEPSVQKPIYAPPQETQQVFTSPFGQEAKPAFTPSTSRSSPQEYTQREEVPRDIPLDQNGDPPLLYDIGIQPEKIKERIILVLKLSQPSYDVIHDPDLSGPIVIALALGFLLLLVGKIHFGDIYAMFIVGNCLLYALLNFMSQSENIPFYNIMSILGYGLLPMLVLGFFGLFMSLNRGIGTIIALLVALWASYAAGNFMSVLMREAKQRRLLIMYPLFLYYLSFTLIVIF